jgi:hypothetical protein
MSIHATMMSGPWLPRLNGAMLLWSAKSSNGLGGNTAIVKRDLNF